MCMLTAVPTLGMQSVTQQQVRYELSFVVVLQGHDCSLSSDTVTVYIYLL